MQKNSETCYVTFIAAVTQ